MTFLDALAAALGHAGSYNARDEIAPAAVLWPDVGREWEPLLPRLRQRLPVLALGSYLPTAYTGPAAWLRCMVARCLDDQPLPTGTPVLYLGGVSAHELRHVSDFPPPLRPLAELRYRGALWATADGRDWTVGEFFTNPQGGLGIAAVDNPPTRQAMLDALDRLADLPLERLQDEAPWKAGDFQALLARDPTVRELIARDEDDELEFKASARWDIKNKSPNGALTKAVIKTVAAFLNSHRGGTLLIGVSDEDHLVRGLAEDFRAANPQRADRDGYQAWLTRVLLDALGRQFTPCIRIAFEDVDGRDVCKVIVPPGSEPAYVQDDKNIEQFYVRAGNTSVSITNVRQAVQYIRGRWGGL
jgi:hypothetical protein